MPLPPIEEMVSELCQSCGFCCTDVANAPLTVTDVTRIQKAYDVSLEDLTKSILFEEQGLMRIRISDTGHCAGMSRKDGKSACNLYEHRPDICRNYVCQVVEDLREIHEYHNLPPDGIHQGMFANLFHEIPADEVMAFAKKHGPRIVRSTFRFNIEGCVSDEEKPPYYADLLRALRHPGDVVNTFPPATT